VLSTVSAGDTGRDGEGKDDDAPPSRVATFRLGG